jgi:hypothetical protein
MENQDPFVQQNIDNPAPQPPVQPHKRGLMFKVAVAIGVLFSAAWIIAIVFFIFIDTTVNNACGSVTKQVTAEKTRQAKVLNGLTIITGQKTQATADGNNDCIDGGPNSVEASADFNTAMPFAQLEADISNNLAKQGYKQVGNIAPDGGSSRFNSLVAGYDNATKNHINVTYYLPAFYDEVCANGNKVCNDPDLQEISQAQIKQVGIVYTR